MPPPAGADDVAGPTVRETARDAGLTEFQEVRRVQIDVSVIDPRGDELSSIPGLSRDAFELRVDHRPLPPELLARVEFDEICPSHEESRQGGASLLGDDRPTLILFVDLNYLDARMRHATAKAVEELAELARTQPLRVKVLAYGRRVVALNEDFTGDPAEIVRAAREITGIEAQGPPLGSRRLEWRGPTTSGSRAVPTPQPDLSADEPQPRDPESAVSAFDISIPGFQTLDETGQPLYNRSLAQRSGQADIDARPSLAALESVLIAHSTLRGRKAIVLFTSSSFDLPDELWLQELRGTRRAAQGGFTIWPVDARGLAGGPKKYSSRLLGFLASTTGGEFLRASGRLALAFDRAVAQLSCYYLFSIPLPRPAAGEREVAIDVRLDTRAHPEYWYYRVRTVSDITLLGRQKEREKLRLAALMEPGAHRFPEVRVTASYPSGDHPSASVVEVGTVLSDLTFTPARDGSLAARLALEGAVVDKVGRTVCLLGDGTEKTIRADAPPARFPPSLLVLRSRCSIPGPGQYEIRAVVEDLETGDIGAAISTIDVADVGPSMARLSGVRLGRGSGRDFLVDAANGGVAGADGRRPANGSSISRDAARRAFVPLVEGEPVVADDRVRLRFVACGSWTPAVVLRPATGTAVPVPALPAGERRSERATCREFDAAVEEGTLEPGGYRLEIRDAARPSGAALSSTEFRVVIRETPAPADPGVVL